MHYELDGVRRVGCVYDGGADNDKDEVSGCRAADSEKVRDFEPLDVVDEDEEVRDFDVKAVVDDDAEADAVAVDGNDAARLAGGPERGD